MLSPFYRSLQREVNNLFGNFFATPTFGTFADPFVDPFAPLDDLRDRFLGLLDEFPTNYLASERTGEPVPMDKEGTASTAADIPVAAASAPAPTPAGSSETQITQPAQTQIQRPRRQWMPRCDVEERPNEVCFGYFGFVSSIFLILQVVIHAELPGIPKEETKLEVDPTTGVVTISGERKAVHDDTSGQFRRVERQWGMFKRSFRLPRACHSKLGEITARAENGIIEIHCPKAPEEQTKPVAINIE